MKILIAGGAGYIGSTLVPRLLDRGYEIEVVDLLWFGNHLPNEVKVIQKDVFHLVERDLQGFDQVVFLGGLSNDPMAEFSPSMNFIYNAAAPAYLGYIAKRAQVKRFIYGSSCSVYGYTVDQLYDEESPTSSTYPYGISKLQGEQAVIQMVDNNFSVICLRQGTVSGYSPRMRLDLIVNAMFKDAISKNEINVNNASIWRPILNIEDAAAAYTRAIEASEKISGIFNVASGNYTVGEVADFVREAVETEFRIKVSLRIHNKTDYRNYKVNVQKAVNVLSFKPRHDVDTTVRQLILNLDKFKDLENPSYYNIQMFKKTKQVIHFEQH